MKQFLIILAAGLMAVSLSACDRSQPKPQTTTEVTTTQPAEGTTTTTTEQNQTSQPAS